MLTPLQYQNHFEKRPPLFYADFARGLHHESPELFGHHTVELRINAVSDYLSAGRKGGKEEGQKEAGRLGRNGGRKLL